VVVAGVRCIFTYVYFPHLLGGFLHILTCRCNYMLWPLAPGNTTCLFLTWYQSNRFCSSRSRRRRPPRSPTDKPGRRRCLFLASGEAPAAPAPLPSRPVRPASTLARAPARDLLLDFLLGPPARSPARSPDPPAAEIDRPRQSPADPARPPASAIQQVPRRVPARTSLLPISLEASSRSRPRPASTSCRSRSSFAGLGRRRRELVPGGWNWPPPTLRRRLAALLPSIWPASACSSAGVD
jgi:hypothetical protein